jgi:tRNA-splicing ligase RtcB
VLGRDRSLGAAFDRLFARFRDLRAPGVADREGRAAAQCGSLGSGNHFVEVCSDESGGVWLMLHSGSRNIGKELAERHIATAKTLEHNLGLPDRDLAVFLAGTDEMAAYLHDLYWAQDYAALNREVMMASIRDVVRKHFPGVRYDEPVRCHHNYVAEESYDGVDVVVTRKGAIRAGTNDLGLIPGSMGTGSFVVRGLGNEASYCSASHGAGRRMSRNAARRRFTVDDLRAQTAGVECRKDAGVIDEIPAAYKDLESVIEAQATGPDPLVAVVHRLTTLLCVKG